MEEVPQLMGKQSMRSSCHERADASFGQMHRRGMRTGTHRRHIRHELPQEAEAPGQTRDPCANPQ